MNDIEIIGLFFNRNESAISECNNKYGHSLKRLSFNILRNFEDCEECLNDTYIKAWESIPPQKPSSLFAYLGRIIRNISINLYNKNRAKKRDSGITTLLSELSDCVPDNSSTEEEFNSNFLNEVIDKWLLSLSEDDRKLFVGRYWFGEDLKTLAKKLNITSNYASVKIFNLRKSLKATLEKEDIYL